MAKKKSTKKKSTATEKTLRAENKKLRAKLDRAVKKADRWKAEARRAGAATKKSSATEAVGVGGPDETWTLAALKDEARTRGLTGYSRLSKADLLSALQ